MDIKKEAKTWIDANVWDGEDRSDCKNDWANFDPDDLQELVNDLIDDLLTPNLEATERKLAMAEKVINSGLMMKGEIKPYQVTMCNTFQGKTPMHKDKDYCIDITEAISDYEASKGEL